MNFIEDVFVTKNITRDAFYSLYWISGTVFKILYLSIIPKLLWSQSGFPKTFKPADESLEPNIAFSRKGILNHGHISKLVDTQM